MAEKVEEPLLVLASGSPRRQALLAEAGYRFVCRPSDIPEPDPEPFTSPETYVAHLAWLKAHAIDSQPSEWILAADTMAVTADGILLGKATDRDDAARILRRLMGSPHRTLTGVCLRLPRARISLLAVEETCVLMRLIDDRRLKEYLDSNAWVGKAGAYGIQDRDDPFVESIEGSFSNVVGLPMERLREMLTAARRIEED